MNTKKISICTVQSRSQYLFLLSFFQRLLAREILLTLCIFSLSFYIAYSELSKHHDNAFPRFIYQFSIESAIAQACGKYNPAVPLKDLLQDYQNSNAPSTPLSEFIQQKRDSLDCNDIFFDKNATEDRPQEWFYLNNGIGVLWKFTGISWSVLDKMLALFFAISISLCYGIFRLGMNQGYSLLLAFLTMGSVLQLSFLPFLRDYSKVPFFLAIFLLLGILVKHSLKKPLFFLICFILGTIIGVGYGVRTDVLITLPPALITVLFFLPEGIKINSKKLLGFATVLVSVYVFAMPVLSGSKKIGSCVSTNSIGGLSYPFTKALRVLPSPLYEIGHQYNDIFYFAYNSVHAQHYLQLDLEKNLNKTIYSYCNQDYAAAAQSLSKQFIIHFPADILIRGFASAKQILNLHFTPWNNESVPPWEVIVLEPSHNLASAFYNFTRPFFNIFQNQGLPLTFFVIFLIGIFRLRIAIFLLFFMTYFAFYPAIQFTPRHFFHLEFISLWMLGFLIFHSLQIKKLKQNYRLSYESLISRSIYSAALPTCFFALAFIFYLSAQRLQSNNIDQLVNVYQQANKLPLKKINRVSNENTWVEVELFDKNQTPPSYAMGKMLYVEFGGDDCPAGELKYTIDYEMKNNISNSFNLKKDDSIFIQRNQKTSVFIPIYHSKYFEFQGIKLPKDKAQCVANIAQVIGLENTKVLWLFLKLPPNWQTLSHYQFLK